MPQAIVRGVALNYELRGPSEAPVLVLSNSLGTTYAMWDCIVPALTGRYRVLRYDTRGHGGSQTVHHPATIFDLADDLAGLMDVLGIARAHIAGLSLGGMTAQAFGVRHPDRAASLSMLATSPYMPTYEMWEGRATAVETGGMQALVDATMTRWFTAAFRESGQDRIAPVRDLFLTIDPAGYAAACRTIRDMDLRPHIDAIKLPTLIIAGQDDPATPPAMAREIRDRIAGSELVELPHAAHLLNIEQPAMTASYLLAFIDRVEGARRQGYTPAATFESGLPNRKAVLGEAHVERSLAKAGAFAEPWQEFITRYAWGEIWGDPALPWKTRSMLTLIMMVALGREEEFKLHVRPALKNGVTIEELRAVLKQAAVYAGVPAANGAFRWVKDVLGEDLA